MTLLKKIDDGIARVENAMLVTLFFILLVLAFFQIPLAKIINTDNIEVLLRQMLLWISLLGASLATREGRHINVDVLSRRLHGGAKSAAVIWVNVASAVICILLTIAAWQVLKDAYDFGETVEIFISIPTWILQTILVFGFGIMAFRFLLKALTETGNWIGRKEAA